MVSQLRKLLFSIVFAFCIYANSVQAITPAIPSSVDNSLLPSFPVIRSQGSLSSCTAFAASYYTLTHEVGLTEGWNNKNDNNSTKFSPKWSYNFVNDGVNGGTTAEENYEILKVHGAATWAEFPYDTNYREWAHDNPSTWRNAIRRRITDYGDFYLDTEDGRNRLKRMLADGHILNFITYINSWQYKAISNDPSTSADDTFVGKQACYWINGTSGCHFMTIVGYNDNIWVDINNNGTVDAGEKGAFRIANSWGTTWKESGFSWLAYDAIFAISTVTGGPSTNRRAAISRVYWIDVRREEVQSPLYAELTVSHPYRNQLNLGLGKGNGGASLPSQEWQAYAHYYSGGAYGFDGQSYAANPAAAPEGTFVYDFQDLLPIYNESASYFLKLRDRHQTSSVGAIKRFKLTDMFGRTIADSGDIDIRHPDDSIANAVYAKLVSNLTDIMIEQTPPGIPEGGQAVWRIKLNAAPQDNVIINIINTEGDADIEISSGAELVFTPSNWNQYQEIVLTAQDDADNSSDSAQIRFDGTIRPLTVKAYEIDNDVIYAASMNENPGWDLQGQWAWGIPQGNSASRGEPDPSGGITANNVIGYNLAGEYAANINPAHWATTPRIDCSDYSNVHLRFYRKLNVEHGNWDHASIEISKDNGTTWSVIWSNDEWVVDRTWKFCDIDVSNFADRQSHVRIRWGMGPTDNLYQCSGWNIDDVTVTGDYAVSPTATGTPFPSQTATATPTRTATPTHTRTPTATRTFTATPTRTSTATWTYTATPTKTPTRTATATITATATPTSTVTATALPTATNQPTATAKPKSATRPSPPKKLKAG